MQSLIFEAIGTRWQIDIEGGHKGPPLQKTNIEKLIRSRIEEFDKTYSRFRQDSFIRQFSVKKGKYILPDDAEALFSLYHDLYKLTNGYFTPLIGQVLSDAGYDEAYSLKPKKLKNPPAWDEVLQFNNPNLIVKQPCLLDFGAAGKGYLIDIVSEILEENGVTSYCVDAGGDIRFRNEANKPIRVGLENPENFRQVIGVANIVNGSICGSAGNRRKWGEFTHIIDPITLKSPETISAVWVIAKKTILADALTTCLFFVSPEKLSKFYKFEYIILYKDFSVKKSEGFDGEFYFRA